MTRRAVGLKCGKPGRPGALSARRSDWSKPANAAMPMPEALSPKKWRRVIGSIYLLVSNRFVEIQNQAGDAGVGGQLGGVELSGASRGALGDELQRGLRVVPI